MSENINERLKELRKEKGVLQRDVAKTIGISEAAYGSYEQGTREPSIAIIKELCKYFQVSAGYLIGLED